MADEMLDQNDPLPRFVFEESRALAAVKLPSDVPMPSHDRHSPVPSTLRKHGKPGKLPSSGP